MTSISSRTPTRNDFRVAIICALPLEARMVAAVFDKDWGAEGVTFDQAENDHNTYTLGAIRKHNVVLVHMSMSGLITGATAAANLRRTFPSTDIAFVVGVCGASPKHIATKQEICLGDCIVSTALIQYGSGRQYPGHFSRKIEVEDVPGKAGIATRSLLAKLQATEELKGELAKHLQVLQEKEPRACYPGAQKDRLYDSAYLHVHRDIVGGCNLCVAGSMVCTKTCQEIGCDGAQPRASLISYENMQKEYLPRVHFGRYGSADIVLKSGMDRDKYTKVDKIVAFEMEAAGIWDILPTLVVKSACDYADSHKNKEWQDYAAATAAAGLKAILEYWRIVNVPHGSDGTIQAANTCPSISECIREADKLIRDYSSSGDRLLIKRLSGQELKLEKCYINLSLIDRSRRNKNEEQMSFSLEERLRLDASKVGQNILLKDLFKSRKLTDGKKTVDPRRIFIQGRAGIGKTTLCKKLVYEFLEKRLGSGLFDRLLWIPLRELKPNQQEEYGWHELLRDTFRTNTCKWKEVKTVYGKQFDSAEFLSRTLFLFDGLDEISHRWNDEDPFYRFLNTIIRSVPNIIITSRPQANVFSLESFDLDLETVGFTVDQVSIYIKNCVEDSSTVAKMERLIAHQPLIRGLLRIPIQLDAFCYIWHEDTLGTSNTGTLITMTILYQSITTELCKKDLKLLGKLKQWERPSSLEIQEKFEGELALLEEIAFYGLLDGVVEFSPQHWDRLGDHLYRSNEEFSNIFKSTLDQLSFLRTSDQDSDYTKRTYYFIHLTYQEFFAARYFTKHWQNNEPLTFLRLTSRGKPGGKPDSKTPRAFLDEEKYNPRYNIFWRFVTGLVSEEKNGTTEFFRQLRAEPIDLIGATHRRLLMYCLSEVEPNQNQELYNTEANLLKQRLIAESKITKEARGISLYNFGPEDIQLGTEAEFPEIILRDCLKDESDLPYGRTLSTIGRRSVVQLETLKIVADKLASSFPPLVRLQAAEMLVKNSTVCSPPVLENAITVTITALENENSDIRSAAVSALVRQSSLPERAVNALITVALKEEKYSVKSNAAEVVLRQSPSERVVNTIIVTLQNRDEKSSMKWPNVATPWNHSLPKEAINILIVALKDEEHCVRHFAVNALKGQSLPKEAIDILFAILQNRDEKSDVRGKAAEALEGYSLPEETINTLLAMLQNKDKESTIRWHIAEVLEKQSLSKEAINTLVAILQNEDEESGVRKSAAKALGRNYLPEEAVNALVTALSGKDAESRFSCAMALREQSRLSEGAVNALTAAFKNEASDVREYAGLALSDQRCLSEGAIDALILLLKDEVSSARESAAVVLNAQLRLPEVAIDALIAALQDEDDNSLARWYMVDALGNHSCLSERGINALIAVLKSKNSTARSSAAEALKKQSPLSDEATMVLVEMLREDNFEIYEILHHQKSFFCMIKNLDIQAWLHLWSAWLRRGLRNDVSCYEFQGSLYLWSGGIRYEILTDPARIDQLRKAVFSKSDIATKEDVTSKSCITVGEDDIHTTKSSSGPGEYFFLALTMRAFLVSMISIFLLSIAAILYNL